MENSGLYQTYVSLINLIEYKWNNEYHEVRNYNTII